MIKTLKVLIGLERKLLEKASAGDDEATVANTKKTVSNAGLKRLF